ncbi:MAG: MFS transporter, partial [Bacilli bacterium]|nr:MFS transporter [Bacilli bacterium]
LAKKLGKKELSAIGLILAVLAYVAMFCLVFVPANGVVIIEGKEYANHANTLNAFYILKALSEVGIAFINLQIWGMIADCIDDVQVKTGVREDGTSYAIFMFFRKFGQVIAAISINASLIAMGYNFAVQNFDESQIVLMYYLGTLIPVAMLGAAALLMLFRYPLTKKRLEELQDEKEAFYAKQELEDKRKAKLPAFTNLKIASYLPEENVAKLYSGFEFEYFVNKEKRFYCVLVKKTQGGSYLSYLRKAKEQFNEDLEDGKVDITPAA